MKTVTTFLLAFTLSAGILAAADAEYTLSKSEKAPEELAEPVAGVLEPEGYRIAAGDAPLLEVWLVKDVAFNPSFQPTFTTKYPFKVGELIGAIRVAEDGKLTDFRGQEIPKGVYTLRYAQQPADGNHVGTAETADFVLALPATADKSPSLIRFAKQLQEKSAEVAGADHPAIFWLAPPGEEAGAAALVHEEDKEFWILDVPADGEGDAQVPLRMVVVGMGEV